MQFQARNTYAASPAEVHAMLADPAFREQVCADQDVVEVEVTITPGDGGGMSVVVDQVQPTQGVPSFATPIIGATTRAIQLEEWADDRSATLEIQAPGKPVTMRGSITLEEAGSGTVEVIDLDIHVKVPLIGGRLEKLMASLVERSIRSENETGRTWLGE
ncbi:MAG: DUF2505 domain-containing protein [Nocardioidaceae bacterium]